MNLLDFQSTPPPRKRLARTFGAALLPAILLAGCGGDPPPAPRPPEVDDREIIGGFNANDAKLDGVGSLVLVYDQSPYGYTPPPRILCGAALITPESVLTAKHCADAVRYVGGYGVTIHYALGPDSARPRRMVEVVAAELAPGDTGGFVGMGRDVAVLHLDSPLTGEPTVEVGSLTDDDLDKHFAAIGYGVQDNSGRVGTRKLGRQTLRARSGNVFEVMFGSFEAFYKWFRERYFGPAIAAGVPAVPGAPVPGGEAPAPAPSRDAGVVGSGGAGGGSGGGGSGGSGGSTDGGTDGRDDFEEFFRMYARMVYDRAVIEPGYEVVTGGVSGDSQVCYGDSGSPLVRRIDGKNIAYAVVSGGINSRDLICDYGAVYASFGPETLAFIEQAKQWVDPCGDMNSNGVCAGTVARRCTAANEGRRRVVEFDCASLDLACSVGPGRQVACGDQAVGPSGPMRPGAPPPAPPIDVAKSIEDIFDKGAFRR